MTTRKRRPGVIRDNELYTYEEAMLRLCVEGHTMRQMKRDGLKIILVGRRNYLLGKHIMEHFEKVHNEKQSKAGK
jgi:hypothetical protein